MAPGKLATLPSQGWAGRGSELGSNTGRQAQGILETKSRLHFGTGRDTVPPFFGIVLCVGLGDAPAISLVEVASLGGCGNGTSVDT